MDKRIRYLGLFLVVCFVLLFLQLNNLQLREHHKLANASGNPREFLALINRPRGRIETSGGTVVAYSKRVYHQIYDYQRTYPEGPLFADITGFFSLIYGSTGLESTENAYLSPHKVHPHSLKGFLNDHRYQADNLILTVSNKVQQAAANALGNEKGAVVALDPRTGAVLAIYSSPSFNPNPLASLDIKKERDAWNSYLKNPSNPMLARAYRRSYPPGSTFKMVTASAVYDYDPLLADVSMPVLTQTKLPDTNKLLANYDHEPCGGQMPVLFEVSCDTGFARIGLALGPQKLWAQANAYGFDHVPPFDLPAVASSFPSPSSFAGKLPELAYSAIGQENVSATALQMALVAGAIANGGVIMTPHVVAKVVSPSGRVIKKVSPKPWRRATPALTALEMTKLMRLVVKGGTAAGLFPSSWDVAAKTGTAQNAPGQCCTNWLATFAPANNPSVVVVAVVPFQPGLPPNPTGHDVAGPVVREVLRAALAYQAAHGQPSSLQRPSSLGNSTSPSTSSSEKSSGTPAALPSFRASSDLGSRRYG